MTTTYSVVMMNGELMDIVATSAANAIQSALEMRPGKSVLRCFSGRTSTIGLAKSLPGTIEYDVPRHKPLPVNWEKTKRAKNVDATEAMFDDTTIKVESENAKKKAEKNNKL